MCFQLESVEAAVGEGGPVDVAVLVLAERRDLLHLELEDKLVLNHPLPVPAQGPHVAGDEVTVEVQSVELLQSRTPIDAAAGDRIRLAMRVLDDRLFERTLPPRLELVLPFPEVPAVIRPLLDDVDLLPLVLTDVGRPEFARLAIKVIAPRIPHSVTPDLRKRVVAAHERVVLWNSIRLPVRRMIDVNPQELPEHRLEILSVPMRVVRGAAVPQPDVEMAVRAELEHAAIVVFVRLLHLEDHLFGLGEDLLVGDLHYDTREDVARVRITPLLLIEFRKRVLQKDLMVAFELRMKRDPQQPFFVPAAQHLVPNIERDLGLLRILGVEPEDAPLLLHDEQQIGRAHV